MASEQAFGCGVSFVVVVACVCVKALRGVGVLQVTVSSVPPEVLV